MSGEKRSAHQKRTMKSVLIHSVNETPRDDSVECYYSSSAPYKGDENSKDDEPITFGSFV